MMETENTIVLFIENVKALQPDLLPKHSFDVHGGVVGSDVNSSWVLNDDGDEIVGKHFEVFYLDGFFCLKDLCGKTFVNGSNMAIGIGNNVRLQHKDTVRISDYTIRVNLNKEDDFYKNQSFLEEFTTKVESEILNSLGGSAEKDDIKASTPPSKLDPLAELDSSIADDNQQLNVSDINDGTYDFDAADSAPTPQAASEFELTSSMRLKKILGFGKKRKRLSDSSAIPRDSEKEITYGESLNMDELNLEMLEKELGKESALSDNSALSNSSESGQNHLVMGPVLNGLDASIGENLSIEGVHRLSEEIGLSLKACVQGLLNVHSQVEKGRFGVLNRNLQPIEDNPLRLGLEYKETMKTMFDADKSIVHLSAPAAIEESLRNIRHHNQAMQEATSEALLYILNSFSPDVLLKRFNNYKRTTDKQESMPEIWAWNMYQSYFDELSSNRQNGFDKLFWEVFEQSYDRKIREMQLES